MPYGFYKCYVSHITKEPTEEEAADILRTASELGIKYYDTAAAYGRAEERMGKYAPKDARIISKLLPQKLLPDPVIKDEVQKSSRKVNAHLNGYLYHTPENIYDKRLVGQLKQAKEEGYVDNIGVSVYEVRHGMDAARMGFDYIQIPYSILDQRFDTCDFFNITQNKGIKVFARSAFLQGLLCSPIENIPEHLRLAKEYIKTLEKFSSQFNLSRIEIAFLFSLWHPHIDYVVFGVDNVQQLKEDIAISKSGIDFEACRAELQGEFLNVPHAIIFPSLWAKTKEKDN